MAAGALSVLPVRTLAGLRALVGRGRGGGIGAAAEIGRIPPGTLELEAGGSDLLGERPSPQDGHTVSGSSETLQDVLGMATGAAFVGVDGHGWSGRGVQSLQL